MKKILAMILLILFLAAACILPAFAQEAPAGKTLIVYYSRSGTTKAACEVLGKALNVDLREIKDRNNREGGLGIIGAMLKINLGVQTDTDPEKVDFGPYKNIVVSAPVWASQPGLAMKTFIENNRFDGKNVVIFITSDSFIEEKYQEKHRQLVKDSGGTVAGYFQVQATDPVNGEKVPRSKDKIMQETLKLVPGLQKALAGR
ncbi:MAG: flavodoxin family protein [Deltaproteobacteria bacterium]|nr:flavodoxin family protein [Deltaproteobacteria bacterium]